MRDTRKNSRYFEQYIAYQKQRIDQKEEKLSGCNDAAKRERVCLSLFTFDLDMLVAEFSYGAGADILSDMIDSICEVGLSLKSIHHESLLIIMSVAVMVNNRSKDVINLFEKNKNVVDEDKLLNCLATYLSDKKIVWSGKLKYNIYSKLDSIDIAEDKEKVILDYLSDWYAKRKDFAWYGTDKSNKDTYVGYWSFESAALAKIFKMEDSRLKKNVYYPSLY